MDDSGVPPSKWKPPYISVYIIVYLGLKVPKALGPRDWIISLLGKTKILRNPDV